MLQVHMGRLLHSTYHSTRKRGLRKGPDFHAGHGVAVVLGTCVFCSETAGNFRCSATNIVNNVMHRNIVLEYAHLLKVLSISEIKKEASHVEQTDGDADGIVVRRSISGLDIGIRTSKSTGSIASAGRAA